MADLVIGVGADIGVAKTSFLALGKAVLDFASDSVKAFAEAEKADAKLSNSLRQLGLNAKALTPIFKEQADAFERTAGVQAESVQQLQALLLTYGTAPKDIEKTTRAILDYSATTGDDAVNATRMLLREIQAGDGNIKKLGISYDSTGSKTKDLALATQALADKFGGAAAAQMNTMGGSLERLATNWGNLKESFGQFIAEVEKRYRVVETLNFALAELVERLEGGREEREARAERLKGIEAERKHVEALTSNYEDNLAALREAIATGARASQQNFLAEQVGLASAALDQARAKVQALESAARAAGDPLGALTAPPGAGSDDATDKARKDEEKRGKEVADAARKFAEERARIEKEYGAELVDIRRQMGADYAAQVERLNNEALKDELDQWRDITRVTNEGGEQYRKARAEQAQAAADVVTGIRNQEFLDRERDAERAQKQLADNLKKQADEALRHEEQMRDAGAQLGAAFINSMAREIEKARAGGELDIAAMILDLTVTALSIAAMASGNAWAVPLIGAGGNLVKAATGPTPNSGPARRLQHLGGVVEEPLKFHTGGEVPALLQSGEVVFSRADVARHGGAGAVESMRTSRGQALTINVNTLDASNFRDFMTDRGGRGLADAVRTGRGPVAALMRKR